MYGNFNAQEEHKGWMIAQSANLGVLPTKEKENIQQSKKTYNKAGTGITNLYNKEYSEQISKQDGTDLHKDLYKKSDKMIRNTKATANR